MLIIRGVNVFPSQVEHALLQVPGLAPHYLLVLRRDGVLDTLEIRVEAAAAAEGPAGEALAARARRRVHETIGLTAEVTVVPPHAIERSVGKARRVQDLRQQGGSHA
jgi:phenylacetate-CoA ligase